ncbi:MAG TPA: hypothetical protein VE777_01410 [Gaiellales bacterium]|jgi:hypothetical protein|nr:hypothetical protein [Gaiellales bacterium]
MRSTLSALSVLAVLTTGCLGGGAGGLGRHNQNTVVITRYRSLPRLLAGAVPAAYPGRLTAGRRRAALLGETRFDGQVRLDARRVDCRAGRPACRAVRVLLHARRPRRPCIGVLAGSPPGADLVLVTGRLGGRRLHLVVTMPVCGTRPEVASAARTLLGGLA